MFLLISCNLQNSSFEIITTTVTEIVPTVMPSRYWVKAISIHFIWKVSCLLSYLLLIHKKNYSYLNDSQYYSYMIIEKILSLTFVTEWTSTGYLWNVELLLLVNISSKLFIIISNCFFWLILLVNSSSSLTTLRFPHSLLTSTNLGKFSKFSMPSILKWFIYLFIYSLF